MVHRISAVLMIFCLFCISSVYAEETVFHYRVQESKNDVRYEYDYEVLKLALDKTVAEYGNYQLVPTPSMTFSRAEKSAQENVFSNFFFKQSYEGWLSPELAYVPFPIDLGIVGFRVCFTSPAGQEKLRAVDTLEQLKTLQHIQGSGWADVNILRANGFNVHEIPGYENMFRMVAAGRADLFCRGANEIYDEYKNRLSIPDLTYDTSMTIVYPLPRFLYTNAENKDAIERVYAGLKTAYADGSLVKLWERFYGESYRFSQLQSRKVFRIDNPLLEKLDTDFEQFLYPPLKVLKQ